jgi:hypothetical protein
LNKKGRSFDRIPEVTQIIEDGFEAGDVEAERLLQLLDLMELVRTPWCA